MRGLAASWLDAGEAGRAIALLEGSGPPWTPATELVRAQALRATGRDKEARALFDRLGSEPGVPPVVREAARAELKR